MSLHWLPNAISILRVLLVPPTLYCILQERFDVALVLFAIAGFSDGVDGWLAKRYDWRSRFGALIDPLADKLLVGGTFIVLLFAGLIPVWLALLVILRDVVIVAGATAYNFLVRPVPGEPTRISKLNTALALLLVVFILSREAFGWPPPISITVTGALLFVTCVTSGIDYVLSWSRRARAARAKR